MAFTEKAGNFQKDNFGKVEKKMTLLLLMSLTLPSLTLATTRGTIGAYVRGEPEGIRSRPYTTDMKVNPWTYGDLKALDEVHDVGEVWASMLWEVYWGLVTKHGFSANLYDASQSAGNIVAMKIIMGCQQVRDPQGICQAWSRLQGHQQPQNDFSVPSECDGDAPSPDPTATDTEETTTTTKRSRTTTKKTKTTATEEATTTTKRSRTTTKRSRTTSRAPEPTDEPDDDPTYEPDEFAEM
ncbi:extracellular metalloproteinase 2 [Batrachochytrium salamandrivorans]|nr:extracellular metalloproteinase 2 [Batrachochytrium salamandrivorans]